jgi:hypothetical protein
VAAVDRLIIATATLTDLTWWQLNLTLIKLLILRGGAGVDLR